MADDVSDVLVVEDNPGDIRMIQKGFEESRIASSVTVVSDGAAALAYLRQRNESQSQLDLMLLDLNIPKQPGEAILEAMQTTLDGLSMPVVVLSGSESENHIHRTYELGADGYFIKPTDPITFIRLIRFVSETVADSGVAPLGKYADLAPAS